MFLICSLIWFPARKKITIFGTTIKSAQLLETYRKDSNSVDNFLFFKTSGCDLIWLLSTITETTKTTQFQAKALNNCIGRVMYDSFWSGRESKMRDNNCGDLEDPVRNGEELMGATLVKIGFFEVNPVTKTGSSVLIYCFKP